jgi:hypothetical protein
MMEKKVSLRTIYIHLQDEGVDVWRPATARHVEADIFEIVTENSNPMDEQWEFNRGQKVKCRHRTTSEGESILVAYKLVSA